GEREKANEHASWMESWIVLPSGGILFYHVRHARRPFLVVVARRNPHRRGPVAHRPLRAPQCVGTILDRGGGSRRRGAALHHERGSAVLSRDPQDSRAS